MTIFRFLILPLVSLGINPVNLFCQTSPELMTVAAFGRHMAIGLSVNSQNRVFVSFPNADGNGDLSLAEVKGGKLAPYPDKSWNNKGDYQHHFLKLQDLFVDGADHLWVLDSRPSSGRNILNNGGDGDTGKFKLIKINTRNNKVDRIYFFDDLNKTRSSLNDVRIDLKHDVAYLSDPGQAALVILNLKTGSTRTVLSQTKFTTAGHFALRYKGREMRNEKGAPFSSNVNGIALTHDFKYFYFKPINKKELFRIETQYLTNTALPEDSLESKVETVGTVGVTHGLLADSRGNIYLTSSEEYSIKYITPEGQVHTLVKDKRLIWPDSMGIGPDGYLYLTCAQIQQLPQWNNGIDKTEYPYRAYRVALP